MLKKDIWNRFVGQYQRKDMGDITGHFMCNHNVIEICFGTACNFGKNDSEFLRNLIFIPITGQMLHFYLDSQLWKFSVDHNRKNILTFLK